MRYSLKLPSFVQYFLVLGNCGCQYLLTPVNRIVCQLCV
ncbi:hypothetical protein T09_13719 [Trichinella sp. T9]|nr:hypothetical protein T09_13719 [Trichinella sp. T9]